MRALLVQLVLILSVQVASSQSEIKILNFQGYNGFEHDSKDVDLPH